VVLVRQALRLPSFTPHERSAPRAKPDTGGTKTQSPNFGLRRSAPLPLVGPRCRAARGWTPPRPFSFRLFAVGRDAPSVLSVRCSRASARRVLFIPFPSVLICGSLCHSPPCSLWFKLRAIVLRSWFLVPGSWLLTSNPEPRTVNHPRVLCGESVLRVHSRLFAVLPMLRALRGELPCP